MGASDAVRRALIAPLTRTDVRYGVTSDFDGVGASLRLLRSTPEVAAGWRCLLNAPSLRGRDASTVGEAMQYAADARARGLVQRWGDYARGIPGAAARFRALGGAPWNPATRDSVVREVRDAILWRAARPDDGRAGQDFAERAERRAAWEHCATGR